MNSSTLVKVAATLGTLLLVCCARGGTNHGSSPPAAASPTPQSSATAGSAIRSFDFTHLAYPNFPDYTGPEKKLLTLKPGEGAPNFISYGDVTGDGIEEAILALAVPTSGSAIPAYVYIYTMEKGPPELLWDFETGDRADGGLRQAYADQGQLVIELYGKDRVIGGQLYRGDEGLCCPSSFTRARYSWTGKNFELVSQETLPNQRGDANVLMPRYGEKR